MRIIGIDPGYAIVGFGVVDYIDGIRIRRFLSAFVKYMKITVRYWIAGSPMRFR